MKLSNLQTANIQFKTNKTATTSKTKNNTPANISNSTNLNSCYFGRDLVSFKGSKQPPFTC